MRRKMESKNKIKSIIKCLKKANEQFSEIYYKDLEFQSDIRTLMILCNQLIKKEEEKLGRQ